MMRYEVQRQDESGVWWPMASHDDFTLAEALLTDKHRRIRDTELGVFIVYSPPAAPSASENILARSRTVLYLGIGAIFAAAIGQQQRGWDATEFAFRAVFTLGFVLVVAGIAYGAYRLYNHSSN